MPNMRVNGKYFLTTNFYPIGFKIKILDKVEASRFGLMVRCMKVGGKIIKRMEKEDQFMLMAMYTMVCGKIIKPMNKEFIVI